MGAFGKTFGLVCQGSLLNYPLLDGKITDGHELFLNGSLEHLGTTTVFQRWLQTPSSGTIALESTVIHSGKGCLKLTSNSSGQPKIYQTIAVEPNTQVKFSLWSRGDGVGKVAYSIWNISLGQNLVAYPTYLPNHGTTFTKDEILINIPANTFQIQVGIYAGSATGSVVYVDDISIRTVTSTVQRTVKYPSATSWVEIRELGYKTLCDTAPDGTIFAISPSDAVTANRFYVWKSIDEGANWSIVPYQVGTNGFPYTLKSVRVLSNGRLLVTTSPSDLQDSGRVYVSNSASLNDGFTFSLKLETAYTVAGNVYGMNIYENVICIGEYGSPDGLNLYVSLNYGRSFKRIFTLPNRIDANNNHIHTACYDPYEKKFWVCVGDNTHRAIYYSSDFGANWISLGAFGTILQGMIQIMPMPEMILFGSDAYDANCFGIKRKASGTYAIADFINFYDVNSSGSENPLCGRPAVIYGNEACTYFGYYEYTLGNPTLNLVTSHLFATRDGMNYFDIAASADLPAGVASSLGISVVCNPTLSGLLYLSYNKGDSGKYLCKVQVPTWS